MPPKTTHLSAKSHRDGNCSFLPRLSAYTVHWTPSPKPADASDAAMPPPPIATTRRDCVILSAVRPSTKYLEQKKRKGKKGKERERKGGGGEGGDGAHRRHLPQNTAEGQRHSTQTHRQHRSEWRLVGLAFAARSERRSGRAGSCCAALTLWPTLAARGSTCFEGRARIPNAGSAITRKREEKMRISGRSTFETLGDDAPHRRALKTNKVNVDTLHQAAGNGRVWLGIDRRTS